MAKPYTPDDQVEAEITRLTQSPYVQLARREQQIKYRRRKYLSELRALEKRGMELEMQGYSLDEIDNNWEDPQ